MRHYSNDDERRIRLLAHVARWLRAGLISAEQAASVRADLNVALRRPGLVLRLVLALFTLIVVGAGVGLVALALDMDDGIPLSMVATLMGVTSLALGDVIAARLRWYRHGVEESLSIAGVALVAVGAAVAVTTLWASDDGAVGAALAAGVVGGAWLFVRFGFLYAAAAGLMCLVMLPTLWTPSVPLRQGCGLIACGMVFYTGRRQPAHDGAEFPGSEGAALQAVSLGAAYIVVNLKLGLMGGSLGLWRGGHGTPMWLVGASLCLVWGLPALGLWIGVRDRERILVNAGLITGVVSLLTTKAYVGFAVRPWDPVALGVVLVAVALTARRWLESGPGGARNGFCVEAVLPSDRDGLAALGIVSIVTAPAQWSATTGAAPSDRLRGGASGGGGASAGY